MLLQSERDVLRVGGDSEGQCKNNNTRARTKSFWYVPGQVVDIEQRKKMDTDNNFQIVWQATNKTNNRHTLLNKRVGGGVDGGGAMGATWRRTYFYTKRLGDSI